MMMGYEPIRWTDKFFYMGNMNSAWGHGVASKNKSNSWMKEVQGDNSSSNYDKLFLHMQGRMYSGALCFTLNCFLQNK